MIPNQESQITEMDLVVQSSKTYKVEWAENTIEGMIDDYDAVYQAVQKILNTERSSYPVYTSNYGVELERLIGKDLSFVQTDLPRVLTEALTADERITGIQNLKILSNEGDTLEVEFDVITIFGTLRINNSAGGE